MPDVYLYGAGGLGREIKALIDGLPGLRVAGFVDDALPPGTEIDGLPVIGGISSLNVTHKYFIISVGSPLAKLRIKDLLMTMQHKYPVIIHPSAILLNRSQVVIGNGTVISAGCILTTNIRIGSHVLLNLNCTVGHDVTIGDCTSVMPGAHISGNVKIGTGVLIGTGAVVLNNITIGDFATIGAGAVVTRHVPEGVTVVGVPARPIQKSA